MSSGFGCFFEGCRIGVEISGRSDIKIDHGSVSIDRAIGERPTAALRLRIPPRAALDSGLNLWEDGTKLWTDGAKLWVAEPAQQDVHDFDEVTIDYPGQPYRAAAMALGPLAYWRLDERAATLAEDAAADADLTYLSGNLIEHRAYQGDAAAVPHGGAPEWRHTSGAGASGDIPGPRRDVHGRGLRAVAGRRRRGRGAWSRSRMRRCRWTCRRRVR